MDSGRPRRSTMAMIFTPLPAFVILTWAPPPLALTNEASMNASDPSIPPTCWISAARSCRTSASTPFRHHVWTGRCGLGSLALQEPLHYKFAGSSSYSGERQIRPQNRVGTSGGIHLQVGYGLDTRNSFRYRPSTKRLTTVDYEPNGRL